jgi:hypothetical protein
MGKKKLGVVVPACHPRVVRKHEMEGLPCRQAWVKSENSISKITRAKRAGSVIQSGRVPA